jgi:hypothetical protein
MPAISERALRAAYRPRPQLDYPRLAVDHTRRHLQRPATDTHWQTYDVPACRGTQQAACGAVVDLQAISATPTCETCRLELARFEALEF